MGDGRRPPDFIGAVDGSRRCLPVIRMRGIVDVAVNVADERKLRLG
jgi:hypothetical protein